MQVFYWFDSLKNRGDSIGHLVVKIDLKALQDTELEEDTLHYLKIVVVLKEITNGCGEKEGTGELYIIGEKSF